MLFVCGVHRKFWLNHLIDFNVDDIRVFLDPKNMKKKLNTLSVFVFLFWGLGFNINWLFI